tara:strand:- start:127 stop:735 length:609 start_codon:yes stop_codon:yes gene_type:complete
MKLIIKYLQTPTTLYTYTMRYIKFLFSVLFFVFIAFSANSACKFDLKLGDDYSVIENKYGPALPAMFPEIKILPVQTTEICPNEKLENIATEYRFLNNKLAAINLVVLNDESNSTSNKLTLMKYVKSNFGQFETGQNEEDFRGFHVFEDGKNFAVYQKTVGENNIINEEIYISNNKFDEMLAKFYYDKEEEQAQDIKKNNEN